MAAPRRTPVIIVTGYAAAGKTTLANLLLGECRASALRVGLIAHRQVEEYGIAPHPLDEAGVEYDEVYDFGSGCLCCSPSGEMTRLLSAWAERLLEGSLALDLLLIKAAPLASPLVFARCIACASGTVADAFQLASIVAVVSPRRALRHLADGSPEWQARTQLEAADLVVVREGDEDDEGDVERLVRAHTQVPLLRLPAAASAAAWARLQSGVQGEVQGEVQDEEEDMWEGGAQVRRGAATISTRHVLLVHAPTRTCLRACLPAYLLLLYLRSTLAYSYSVTHVTRVTVMMPGLTTRRRTTRTRRRQRRRRAVIMSTCHVPSYSTNYPPGFLPGGW